MQKEAENRVREMQSRARLLGEGEGSFFPPQKKIPQNQLSVNPIPSKNLFSVFEEIGNDKLIILALLWILWNEKADPKLLLALLYLLL